MTVGFLKANGQACTVRGQTPASAFPVCGTKNFVQESVPLCSNRPVPGGCNTDDTNPFWYKFTCFKSGTLGFVITPKNLDEDYDWQLFDITGHSPDEVYTNESLTVTANWAGTYGTTGTSSTGVSYRQCGSNPTENKPTFAAMPNIVQGHTYLLLISHFTPTQSGYSLSFNGGTASITDTLPPNLASAAADCDGSAITITLNKKMQCTSLAADGSDFSISAPGVLVVAADAVSCASGFDMDKLVIKLNKSLAPGSYTIQMNKGSDDNTLLDNCDNSVPEGASVSVIVLPKQPTPMDSLTTPACAPQTLQLVFAKPMRCSSIADDGSDFIITGPSQVAISRAEGTCNDGVSNSILVHLATPIVHNGTYTIALKNGTDGTTLIDECGEITPAGSSLSFSVKDTVSAAITTTLLYGCKWDTVLVAHDGKNDVHQWNWLFDGNYSRTTQQAQVVYNSYGEKKIKLMVSNGFCSDTATTTVNLDNELKARMNGPAVICPTDPVVFADSSIGNIVAYKWNFGFTDNYLQKIPPVQFYPQSEGEKNYTVSLIVQNEHNCYDTALQVVKVPFSCYIAVPTAFTPNGDGRNDFLYPLNAYKANHVDFRVYNRYGQLVFRTNNWQQKWDGTINGQPAANGTYVWVFSYTHSDTGKPYFLKGTSVLIR
ncbi:gliding motility-associated C-terminal domain-containing protein [Ilyomonas limi]|nr:gliding motility-associated C-terminal domain-containing protein [Ilyomonas limi]